MIAARSAGAQDAAGTAAPTVASVASGVHTQTFRFAAGSDVSSAQLFLVPLAYQAQVSRDLVLDGYAAYASGTVGANNELFHLRGPVDSWLRLRWAAKPWAVVAFGLSAPTGVASHTASEAVVATILSSDLLGFREGTWGAGGSGTAGISTVHQLGAARMTMGLSYRLVGAFDPRADTTVRYAPGNETRARVGLDMNLGGGHFEAGLTAQSFAVDRMNGKNLFQSGARYRADVQYNVGSWSVYAADLWRTHGELTTSVLNVLDGSFLRDTTTTVGWQNLMLGGASTFLPIGSKGYGIQPMIEAKLRGRPERAGRGWMTSVGAGAPFRALGLEMFPQVKVTRGAMIPSDSSAARSLWGGEFSLVARRAWARRP